MRVLLLAGTSEARDIAQGLPKDRHHVVASLAGATRAPADLGCETRVGGFGGDAGFQQYLRAHPVDLVIDATHPFAHRVTARTVRICNEQCIPVLQVVRPEWRPGPDDRWSFIDAPHEARRLISKGARVFLATGRQTLQGFANLSDCRLYCRQIDPPEKPFPFPNGEYVIGRPPFSVNQEVALFQRLGVDVLVVKNAGGEMSRSKLDAARQIGLPVIVINRPMPPEGPKVETAGQALEWVATHADH